MRLLLLMALAFISCLGSAQARDGMKIEFGKNAKTFHLPLGIKSAWVEPAFEDYAFMLEDACKAMNLTGDECLIYPMNGDIGANALAMVANGNRIIVYGRTLSPKIGYEGAQGVMAHELGHLYCRHSFDVAKNHWQQEIEADSFAGATLRRMNYSLDQALAMTAALDDRPTTDHPPRGLRVKAIEKGWNNPEGALKCRSNG